MAVFQYGRRRPRLGSVDFGRLFQLIKYEALYRAWIQEPYFLVADFERADEYRRRMFLRLFRRVKRHRPLSWWFDYFERRGPI